MAPHPWLHRATQHLLPSDTELTPGPSNPLSLSLLLLSASMAVFLFLSSQKLGRPRADFPLRGQYVAVSPSLPSRLIK